MATNILYIDRRTGGGHLTIIVGMWGGAFANNFLKFSQMPRVYPGDCMGRGGGCSQLKLTRT